MTTGQRYALEQLRDIEGASSGALDIIEVREQGELVVATISIACSEFETAQHGLPLRSRERFILSISAGFPFKPPSVFTPHKRFAGYPHVQWGHSLCLYQSPATEWDASDGLNGLLERLVHWLQRGAKNEFEATGEALHPPVAYARGGTPLFIPRDNTPQIDTEPWVGVAHLRIASASRIDIVGWSDPLVTPIPANAALAILLPGQMSWEYPKNGSDMISALAEAGVSKAVVLLYLAYVALHSDDGQPIYIVIGSKMRGIAGTNDLRQHLTVWQIESERAGSLRLTVGRVDDSPELEDVRQRLRDAVGGVLELVDVAWCPVREDRPEIVTRRDSDTSMSWFSDKTVGLWGCGALGAAAAEAMVRAGITKIILRDKSTVAPGILVRQPYDDADVGVGKAEALGNRLRRIRPYDLDVTVSDGDILDSPLDSADWTEGVDIMIDASTSAAVLEKLELRRRTSDLRVPIASLVIGHEADTGLVVLAGPGFSGGPADVTRRMKLAAANRPELAHFVDEFWPEGRRRAPFQPEPGCSEPTFVGSWADVIALTGSMLNALAKDLLSDVHSTAYGHLFMAPHRSLARASYWTRRWMPDVVLRDVDSGYDVRLSRSARRDISAWIETSRRRHGSKPETGGILFGERNDASGVIWVDEVLGPPPDSEASPELFVCGSSGVASANDEKRRRSRGSTQFVGMWHTHPVSPPIPSKTDFAGVAQIVTAKEPSSPKMLLLIVGNTARGREYWNAAAYVFSRREFEELTHGRRIRFTEVRPVPQLDNSGSIGLALSGGGARAIAFHLGCLRALDDLGLLEQVSVISGVSGGSVIAAAYAYSDTTFSEFEKSVLAVLRAGLARGIARRVFLSSNTPRAIGTTLLSGAAALSSAAMRTAESFSGLVKRGATTRVVRSTKFAPPLPRWYTRTHALRDTLSDKLFKGKKITAPRRNNMHVVLNACELRTGTAFRFGSKESGNWRFGALKSNDVDVAFAVAASAAYPAILPAFDERMQFVRSNGEEIEQRVILTDGGVFENLGVSCLEPDRQFGYNTFSADYLVACDAGSGQFSGDVVPYGWMTRMQRSFETVFRKAHDGTLARLHSYVPSGKLKGFVLSYLGQMDGSLPLTPPDLVPRDSVASYPTDFSAMPEDDIVRLSLRGEQLTRMLVARYCAEI